MWCPQCKTEYTDDIYECPVCKTALVEADSSPSHAYVSKRAKAEDLKSTAYTFTVVSVIGFVVLLLFLLGVLPIAVADYMKVLISVVMGIMLLIFLIIGIRSFRELKPLYRAADTEDALLAEVTAWFKDTYFPSDIDHDFCGSDVAQLYFKRYAIMQRLIHEKYPDLEEAFADHIIETLYGELFPDTASEDEIC